MPVTVQISVAGMLHDRFKDQTREDLEKRVWMLELQNAALLDYGEKQNKLARNRMRQIKRLKINLRNQEVISAQLSQQAHGG